MTTGRTVLCGLIGDPVAHSLSPAIHSAVFAALGLDYTYLAFCVKRRRVGLALRGLRALGVRGLNVTAPLKSTVLPYLDEVDSEADRIGAVNTIVFEGNRLKGYNTDAPGFSQVLAASGFDPSGKKAVVLGVGGVAAAIAFALIDRVERLVLVTRRGSTDKGRTLAKSLGPRADVVDLDGLGAALQGASLLVNATNVGMTPHEDKTLVPAQYLKTGLTVFDAVYNPQETSLLQCAREAGCHTISGLEMLLFQGALSSELWTGVAPPIDIMRQAALDGLDGYPVKKNSIALIGFMGCGKTTVGKVMARRLGRQFLDTDAIVEGASGKSVSRIFAEDGEPAFRAREAQAVREALEVPGAVISCGGGVVLDAANIKSIKEKAVAVYLKASPQVVLARIGHSRRRPLLLAANKEKTVTALLGARETLYEQAADITIDTTPLSVESVADAIITALRTTEDGMSQLSPTPRAV